MTPTSRTHALGSTTVVETAYPAGYEIAPHAHAESKVSLVVSGSLTETAGSRTWTGGPLHAVVKPAGVGHSDRVGPAGARLLTVWFDREVGDGIDGFDAAAYSWTVAGDLARRVFGLWLDLAGGLPPTEDRVLDVVAAIGRPKRSGRNRPRWLGSVEHCIESDISRRPVVTELAREAGVHPVHLTRVFRQAHGCTITDYVHRLRVQEALGMLTRGVPMVEIALGLGFSDQAHFSRVFKRVTGATASTVRGRADG